MFGRSDHEKLKELEDEQEELNGSLLALTSHFAKVHVLNIATRWLKCVDGNKSGAHKG